MQPIKVSATLSALLSSVILSAIASPALTQEVSEQSSGEGNAIREIIIEQTQSSVEVFESTITVSDQDTISDWQAFDAVMQEANALAEDFIEQGFSSNPNASEVVVTILGDRDGQIIPLVNVRVSRDAWRSQPQLEQWARYTGRPARQLLGMVRQETPPPVSPSVVIVPNAAGSPAVPAGSPSAVVPSNFVPISTGATDTYVLPGRSLEESDPGYR